MQEAFGQTSITADYVVEIRYHQVDWEVIVEPDFEEQLLVIVTAYPIRESKGR